MTKTNNLIKKSRHVLIYLKDSMNTMDTNQNNENSGIPLKLNDSEAILQNAELTHSQKEIQECITNMQTTMRDMKITMESELVYAERSMKRSIQHLERCLKIWNGDLK